MIRFAVITASDKGAAGQREDASGALLRERLSVLGRVVYTAVLPDERALLAEEMRKICDEDTADVIFTTGGTGFSPRDITPEATADIIERAVPGIPEAMRARSLAYTDRAMLSRAAAGIRKKTLVINLPGSPKAVDECLSVVLPVLEHAAAIMRGEAGECAR